MTRFDNHPANSTGLRVGEMDVYKDRRPTLEQLKEQKQLKKLRKKRRKGKYRFDKQITQGGGF